MNIIKSTHTVSDRLSASNFREKVFRLFEAYVHNQIFVCMETETGEIVSEEFEVKYSSDFDKIYSVITMNIMPVRISSLNCTVMVRR